MEPDWRDRAEHSGCGAKDGSLLKAEVRRAGVVYAQLAERIGDKEPDVRYRLAWGKVTAAFLLHSLICFGAMDVRL